MRNQTHIVRKQFIAFKVYFSSSSCTLVLRLWHLVAECLWNVVEVDGQVVRVFSDQFQQLGEHEDIFVVPPPLYLI